MKRLTPFSLGRHRACRRRGFSLIELMIVLGILGLLAALGLPRYRDMKRRAIAAAVASDLNTVRVAAYAYFADNNTYPADGTVGMPPAAMIPYLPKNFTFDNGSYTLDYDVWPSPSNPSQLVVAVTVTSGDQELVNMVARNNPAGGVGLAVGNGFTYIFAGT